VRYGFLSDGLARERAEPASSASRTAGHNLDGYHCVVRRARRSAGRCGPCLCTRWWAHRRGSGRLCVHHR